MGFLLILLLFPICVVAIVKRQRSRVSIAVPVGLAVYCVFGFVWSVRGIIHVLAEVAGVDPAMKATLLAKGISELLLNTAIAIGVHVPLLLGAYFVDRKLRR